MYQYVTFVCNKLYLKQAWRFPVEFGNINDHRKIIKTYLVMKKLTSDNGQSDCDEAGNHKISNSPFNPKFLHGKLVYLIENVHGVV